MNNDSTYLFCRSQMDADEVLLWHGRPNTKGLCLSKMETAQFCFGIGFILFSVLCLTIGWINVGPDPLLIGFTIAFPAAGILVAGSALKNGLKTRNNTEYAITNKRIFRRVGIRVEVYTDGISDGYETILHRDGTATISFAMVIDPNAGRYYVNGREVIQTLRIVRIADVEAVHRALSALNCRPI